MAEEVDRAPDTFVMNRADSATRPFPDANPPRVTFAPSVEPHRGGAAVSLLGIGAPRLAGHPRGIAISEYDACARGVLIHRPQIRAMGVEATIGIYGWKLASDSYGCPQMVCLSSISSV